MWQTINANLFYCRGPLFEVGGEHTTDLSTGTGNASSILMFGDHVPGKVVRLWSICCQTCTDLLFVHIYC